ncbi:hypothetical protein TRICI_002808 [Trichomonascus ciferrii]|uniref:Myb-like domain-containing protein n=1 Tax=Trichomonascus ciferrii TaxID=44093 RepID=A0A642V5W3_9ASCO|nr:hypothetical protein TRICI_002808 [Trichomonascus ciferrii]
MSEEDEQFYAKGYGLWFNNEVYEVLTGTPPVETTKSGIKAGRVPEDKEGMGTFWTAREKELFFIQLSRKSRHDLASVAEAIGTKSLAEVEQYHDLLFEQSQAHPGLVGMDEMPAASEMSEEWVNLEDQQSRGLEDFVVHQQEADQDESTRIYNPDRFVRKTGDIPEEFESYTRARREKDALINVPNLMHIADRVYFNAIVDESNPEYRLNRRPLHYLNKEFIDELESITRFLIRAALRGSIGVTERRMARLDYPVNPVVRDADMDRALSDLGMPRSTKLYWRNVCRRLNLGIRYGVDGYIMDHDTLEKTLDQDPSEEELKELEKTKTIPPSTTINPNEEPQSEQTDVPEITFEDEDPAEEALVNWETALLDQMDTSYSQASEKVLVRFISTYDNPTLLSADDAQLIKALRRDQYKRVREKPPQETIPALPSLDEDDEENQRFQKFLKTRHSSGYNIG